MKIYRIAQTSSIMYKGLPTPDIAVPSNVLLTPSPYLAKNEGEHVAAFALKGGEFFSPDMMDKNLCKALKSMFGKGIDCYRVLFELINNPTKQWNDFLSGMGYSGFIADDYLYLFDKRLLKFLGFYDFERRTLKK